jgi:hypothetical protein
MNRHPCLTFDSEMERKCDLLMRDSRSALHREIVLFRERRVKEQDLGGYLPTRLTLLHNVTCYCV